MYESLISYKHLLGAVSLLGTRSNVETSEIIEVFYKNDTGSNLEDPPSWSKTTTDYDSNVHHFLKMPEKYIDESRIPSDAIGLNIPTPITERTGALFHQIFLESHRTAYENVQDFQDNLKQNQIEIFEDDKIEMMFSFVFLIGCCVFQGLAIFVFVASLENRVNFSILILQIFAFCCLTISAIIHTIVANRNGLLNQAYFDIDNFTSPKWLKRGAVQ